jgi:hypothetical protein
MSQIRFKFYNNFFPDWPNSVCRIKLCTIELWGTQWRSWLMHCAISQQVADSIPDGVITISHRHNLSGRTMALRSTQPLREMNIRNISWG